MAYLVAQAGGGAMLLGLALINPDCWIAEQNLDRYESTSQLDIGYLAGLSADAAPALVALPEELRRCVLEPVEPDAFLGWNYGLAAGALRLPTSRTSATPCGPAQARSATDRN